MVYPYDGILHGSRRECCIDTDHNMISLENRTLSEGGKSDTKATCGVNPVRKCTEWANPQRESGRLVLCNGLGDGECLLMGYGVCLWGDEGVSTSIVVKAAQLVDVLKLIESHT